MNSVHISGGTDRRMEVVDGIIDAQLLDAAIPVTRAHPAADDFRGLKTAEIARLCLEWVGQRTAGMSPQAMVDAAMTRSARDAAAGIGTADLPGIVLNVAQKAATIGAAEAASSWREITRQTSVKDFCPAARVGLSEFPLLEQTPENNPITQGGLSTRTEYVQAAPFARLITISRAALLANDADQWTAIPRAIGAAGDATINQAVFNLLAENAGLGPVLSADGKTVFHADHGNYAIGAAPSVARLDLARQALRRQADPTTGRKLNIPARIILAPPGLESLVRVLTGADAIQGDQNNLRVVIEATLEDATNGLTAWYVLADPRRHDGLEVAFVDGQSAPILEQVRNFKTDGISIRARLDFGVAALDYRALYRDRGA